MHINKKRYPEMGRNRVYTREFRLEAAGLVVDQNYSLKEASEAMGVSKSGLSGWVKQLTSHTLQAVIF